MKPSMSAASRRLLRRHTDSDAFDGDKNKNKSKSRHSSRKRFTRLLSLSSTRTQLKVSTSTSSSREDTGNDLALADVSEVVTDTASSGVFTLEESTLEEATFHDDMVVTSTLIDIDEHHVEKEKAEKRVQDIDVDDDEDDTDTCENFFSKLLDMVQCFPTNQLEEQPQEIDEADSVDFDSNMTKIELILKQTINEESDNDEYETAPATPPLNDTSHNETSIREMTLPSPSDWIQEPLLLVATPGSGMQIRRIRWVSDPSYFDFPDAQDDIFDNNRVIQLPINNGKEQPMRSWVIDFETPVFAGSALFRIRDAEDWKPQDASTDLDVDDSLSNSDYFAKLNRKFQMVMRGKFKSNVVMADCMSGLLLDHPLATSKSAPMDMDCVDGMPCSSEPDVDATKNNNNSSKRFRRVKKGKCATDDSLPPKWALRAAVKVAHIFSPRMDTDLECANPRILSPLCSTAQTIHVSRQNSGGENTSTHLCETHEEPCPSSVASLVNDLNNCSIRKKVDSTATNRAQKRKRAFDSAYDARVESLDRGGSGHANASPCFDTDAEYTFEFLQHLIDYNDLSLDLGKVLGKVRVGGALRGQPVRFIAAAVKQRGNKAKSPVNMDDLDCLWSFDMWHQSLLPNRV